MNNYFSNKPLEDRYFSNESIASKTEIAFFAKDHQNYLCEEALSSREEFEREILNNLEILPDGPIKASINNGIASYKERNPEKACESNILDTTKPLVLVRKNPEQTLPRYGGFINVAIIIYSAINIGFIVAIALLK